MIAGFVDAKPLVDLCLSAVESPALLSSDDLGLADLRGLTYHAGFEGKAWRDTIKIHGAAECKGLLKIAGATQPVDLENLPPLPADATSVRVCAFDFAKISDEVIKTYQRLSKTYQEVQERDADAGKDEAASAWDAAKQFLESSIVKDIVGSLGPQVVTFNSPAEGPWVLGWGMAIQVQDTDRLGKILNVLDDGLRLADAFGVKNDFKLKKRKYHGVDLYTLHTTIDQPFSPELRSARGLARGRVVPASAAGLRAALPGKDSALATFAPSSKRPSPAPSARASRFSRWHRTTTAKA